MSEPLRFPASLEAPYHTVDALHAALRSTVAAHDSLTLEWLWDDASAQVEGVDDDDAAAAPLAVLRTRDTTRAAPSPRRLRALVLFGEHAREAITSEVALRVAALLGGGGGDDGAVEQRAASLRRRVDVALMPLVNVRGRRLFERGDFCRRGNARNVDLNRNWPTPDWGGREAEHAITDCEPGPAPLSEPETRSIAAWATRWRPDLFLCVHSGQLKLLTPLAHSFTPPRHHAAHQRVIGALNRRLRAPLPSSSIGQASTSVGYVSRGTSLDWFYLQLNVSAAFAFEIGQWSSAGAPGGSATGGRAPPTTRARSVSTRVSTAGERSEAAGAATLLRASGVQAGALLPAPLQQALTSRQAHAPHVPYAPHDPHAPPDAPHEPHAPPDAPHVPSDPHEPYVPSDPAHDARPPHALRGKHAPHAAPHAAPRGFHDPSDPHWCLRHFNPSSTAAYEQAAAPCLPLILTLTPTPTPTLGRRPTGRCSPYVDS